MTGDADLKAYTDVVKLAKRLHGKVEFLCAVPLARKYPWRYTTGRQLSMTIQWEQRRASQGPHINLYLPEQVNAPKLLGAWKQLFLRAPWDPTHQVLIPSVRHKVTSWCLTYQNHIDIQETTKAAPAIRWEHHTSMGAPICISMRWDWPYYVAGSGPVKGLSLCHASGTPNITGTAPTGFPALKHGQREV